MLQLLNVILSKKMLFTISINRKLLAGINCAYIFVAFILMGVGSYAKYVNLFDSLPIVGGISVCGIFLMVLAIIGIVAIFKQSQSLMFYYMIFLGIIFVVQFFISIACLAVTEKREMTLVESAWKLIDNPSGPMEIHLAEMTFGCCGFNKKDERRNMDNFERNTTWSPKLESWTNEINWCIQNVTSCKKPRLGNPTNEATDRSRLRASSGTLDLKCPTCDKALKGNINHVFNKAGGIGLFFSLTEIVTLLITYVYREQCAYNANATIS